MHQSAIDTLAHAHARQLHARAIRDENERQRADEFMAGVSATVANLFSPETAATLLIAGYNAGRALYLKDYPGPLPPM